MADSLLSVGIDVGTTSTQLVFSRLQVENRAGQLAVPEMAITGREILYRSGVHFTPLLRGDLVDAPALGRLLEEEYRKAGITRQQVDTGAVLITGETSRRENAQAVLEVLSGMAGEFVVAAAGPDLESRLAARGSGAVDYSAETGKTVLHMDIGGGTSNLALIREGTIVATGCLNVGGRLVKITDGAVTYISSVLSGLTDLRPGDRPRREQLLDLARQLTAALEMAAGLRPADSLLERLWTKELNTPAAPLTREAAVISFSGGVADCIETDHPFLAFGDLGPELGMAIRGSRLCRGEYRLGEHTIRATVMGAGCHSTALSGSTVFCREYPLPVKDLPVVRWDQTPGSLRRILAQTEGMAVVALKGPEGGYAAIHALADTLAEELPPGPAAICLERDCAAALGQALALRLGQQLLCIDRVALPEGSYLDVGKPIGPAFPVVVKTLVLGTGKLEKHR